MPFFSPGQTALRTDTYTPRYVERSFGFVYPGVTTVIYSWVRGTPLKVRYRLLGSCASRRVWKINDIARASLPSATISVGLMAPPTWMSNH